MDGTSTLGSRLNYRGESFRWKLEAGSWKLEAGSQGSVLRHGRVKVRFQRRQTRTPLLTQHATPELPASGFQLPAAA